MTKSVVKRVTTETVDDEGTLKTIIKEHPVKEVTRKKKSPGEKKMTAKEREELLIENFVGLQHAMTNMSIKFGALSDNISKLLQIFEESAKNFVSGGKPDDKEMLEKIDSLLNQNKTIAKGLVLMEGKLRGRSEGVSQMVPPRMENSMQQGMQPNMRASMSSNMQQGSSANFGPRPLPSI
ncbi:hypothetical protein J4226_05565 [Candidatus Pacearchaeota archaeon]|nr:hypothetical protein [Candidatus Pacearchaeota archaeon]